MNKGLVLIKNTPAGTVWQNDEGFHFQYLPAYVAAPVNGPVSLTLPVRQAAYNDTAILPFFDGLIPEGWLLDIAADSWKINRNNRMELLLTVCKDCIGAVSIERIEA